jgi:hypothetical protein
MDPKILLLVALIGMIAFLAHGAPLSARRRVNGSVLATPAPPSDLWPGGR